ncbi:MAG: carbamoyltransferase HypF, partial [Campylobacterales bacterium]
KWQLKINGRRLSGSLGHFSREGRSRLARRFLFKGVVQGVGFRPTIYRVATQLGLTGYVRNLGEGVEVWVEGEREGEFLEAFFKNLPQLAKISSYISRVEPRKGFQQFQILYSRREGVGVAIPPDTALCPDCQRELLDPTDRRYLYPFINCTNCGPRWTILYRLPYDRPNTSMAQFPLCPKCAREYQDPTNRRYHAQPVSCWECGPTLSLWVGGERVTGDPIREGAQLIKKGKIVAVKGVGGFHLIGVATDPAVVAEIRRRKRRPAKPFALLFPDLEQLKGYLELSPKAEELLTSPEAPILLLRKRGPELEGVAPGIGKLGVILPYSPLHLLLAREVGTPLILTSCNISDTPLATTREEVEKWGLADGILDYNREIVNRADDSVLELTGETPIPIRLGRGYTPKLITRGGRWGKGPIFGAGADLKGTIALQLPEGILLSPHIGDLGSVEGERGYWEAVNRFRTLYPTPPEVVAVDKHPRYWSRRFGIELAKKWGGEVWEVQHHIAHLFGVVEELGLPNRLYLGIGLDGTGFGDNREIWGGEFFIFNWTGYRRIGHFPRFKLIGGEQGVKRPALPGIALLRQLGLEGKWAGRDRSRHQKIELIQKLERGPFPFTTSAGRLFDIVAYLIGAVEKNLYEGYTGLRLEALYKGPAPAEGWPLQWGEGSFPWRPVAHPLSPSLQFQSWWAKERERLEREEGRALPARLVGSSFQLSVAPLFQKLITLSQSEGATLFINSLIETLLSIGALLNLPIVASGGVFQNRPLLEGLKRGAEERGLELYLPRGLPPNDGAISVGQVGAVKRVLQKLE